LTKPQSEAGAKLRTTLSEEIIMNSNVKTESRIPVAFSIAMLLACAATVSSAFADDQVRAETVKFADLNVNTPAGAEALYTRIHRAAQRVCSQNDPGLQTAASACARKAEAQAIEKLSLPQLTAHYQMKTGKHNEPLSASR
jgi:UrcA family protein